MLRSRTLLVAFLFAMKLYGQSNSIIYQQLSDSLDKGSITYVFEKMQIQLDSIQSSNCKIDTVYVQQLLVRGRCLSEMGQFENAEKVFDEAIKLATKIAPKSILFGSVCYYAGCNHLIRAQFVKAEDCFDLATKLLNTSQSKILYTKSLLKIGELYFANNSNSRTKGEKAIEKALQLSLQYNDTATYVQGLIVKGLYLERSNDILTSDACFDKAFKWCKYVHVNTIKTNALVEIGYHYYLYSAYAKSDSIFSKLLPAEKVKKILGESNYNYAIYLLRNASIQKGIGNDANNEMDYLKSIEILKANFGDWHPSVANAKQILGLYYSQKSVYPKVEPLYKDAQSIIVSYFGKNSTKYLSLIDYWGSHNYRIGQFDEAIKMKKEALELCEKILGKEHRKTSTYNNNLAVAYFYANMPEKALPYYFESLRLKGKYNRPSGINLSNISRCYIKMGDYKTALEFAQKGLIERQKLKEPLALSSSYEALATIYLKINNLNKADSFINLAYNLRLKQKSQTDLKVLMLNTLAQIKAKKNDFLIADSVFNWLNNHYLTKLYESGTYMSERERLQLIKLINLKLTDINKYYFEQSARNVEFSGSIYNNLLTIKGNLLRSSCESRESLLGLLETYDKWLQVNQNIGRAMGIPVVNRKVPISTMENEANELEKKLAQQMQLLSSGDKKKQVAWKQIKNKINKNEAAIEFAMLRKGDTDTLEYFANIILPNQKYPIVIKLFNENKLKYFFEKYFNNQTFQKKIYATNINNSTSAIFNNPLYDLIWQPLEPWLKDIEKVNISPIGLLHKISFNSIPLNMERRVVDKYQINTLFSTAQLISQIDTFAINKNSQTVLFGGIDYDTPDSSLLSRTETRGVTYKSAMRGVMGHSWQYLDGTLNEVTNLNSVFKKSEMNSSVISGTNATKNLFVKLSEKSSPNIIHIATHGFFTPKTTTSFDSDNTTSTESDDCEKPEDIDNPLLRSGLIFAGANKNGFVDTLFENYNDGVLTAHEVSYLNLSNTKLVVLSACETGLGDITATEGVFGLQRAFKMAGVEYILMSLWQISDNETSEFMSLFYNNILQTKNIKLSFRNAQMEMKKKYDYFYWGAFVLID